MLKRYLLSLLLARCFVCDGVGELVIITERGGKI